MLGLDYFILPCTCNSLKLMLFWFEFPSFQCSYLVCRHSPEKGYRPSRSKSTGCRGEKENGREKSSKNCPSSRAKEKLVSWISQH